MKILNRILSYVTIFLLGCAATLMAVSYFQLPVTKLTQLEYLIENRFIGDYDKTKLEDAGARAMIASLGDRWSYYIPAADYAAYLEQNANAYVGIGITIQEDEAHLGFRIISVQSGGPAEEAGVLPQDLLVAVEGNSVVGLALEDLRNQIRGPEGSTVTIEVKRGEEPLSFEVKRANILFDVVTSQMLDSRIGLVRIDNFDSRCAKDAIAAIEDLVDQGAEALIFDVRNNRGGYAHELVALLDYLLPEGVLFRSVDYAGNESIDKSDANFLDLPMAVLCNGSSYSAAEFFAAAIQEYQAGVVVGTPTCGKGYYQTAFPLRDGSAVGLSIGKYYTPNGNSLIDVGIQPDILVEVTEEEEGQIYYGLLSPLEDPQILAAMEFLS